MFIAVSVGVQRQGMCQSHAKSLDLVTSAGTLCATEMRKLVFKEVV